MSNIETAGGKGVLLLLLGFPVLLFLLHPPLSVARRIHGKHRVFVDGQRMSVTTIGRIYLGAWWCILAAGLAALVVWLVS